MSSRASTNQLPSVEAAQRCFSRRGRWRGEGVPEQRPPPRSRSEDGSGQGRWEGQETPPGSAGGEGDLWRAAESKQK